MPAVDLILVNADIVTMDPLRPRATALAAGGGRVLALGDSPDMLALAGPGARVVDCGGRMVLPGLQDTHIHLQDSGFDYGGSATLDGARTAEALVRSLADFAKGSSADWVTGVGWYTGVFHDGNLTRQVLDRAVPDRPCFILGSDGHNACLNSAACAALGLDTETPDPPGGHFVRDAQGRPTGMLHESAIAWARARMPAPTDADYEAGVRYGQALANRHGITGIIDASVEDRHARVYRRMAEADALTLHVAATARVDPSESVAGAVERVSTLRREAAEGPERFRIHSAKFFLDGVFENRTATMLEPYSDAIGGNAPLLFAPEQVPALFTAFDAARFQIHAHVIGDGAVRAALDGVEAARRANGAWPGLHQLAHVQCVNPADIPRFAALGVMANIQPFWARHAPSVTDVTLPMVGKERGRLVYAFGSLFRAGADFALSSDWGVTTLNPFRIMETAMTRQPTGGGAEPFLPDEALTRRECLLGYTLNAARAAWRGQETGQLSPGARADLIVLDRDLLACDPVAFGETGVLLTLVDGAEVWRDPGFDG